MGLLRQGNVVQAEAVALEALRLDPESAENIAALGLVRMHQARLDEAESELRRAVELKPLYAEGWANLGFLLHKMGRLEEAATALRRSLEIKPFKSATYNSLGGVLRSLEQWEEACEALRQACALAPRRPDYLTNLGAVYSDMERIDDALDALREALRIAPDHLPARANMPKLHTLAGRLDLALAEARELVKRNPEFAGGHHNLAAVCNKLDLLDEAEAEAQRAVELAPQVQKHQLALAEILKRLGKLDKALGAARTALTLEENAKVRFRLGMILRDRGEAAEAIKNFRRCLELDPEDNEGASMFLAAMNAKASPVAAPAAYIRRVFDSYAARFDDHLVKGLRYVGPQRYLEALLPRLPRQEGLSILDLGCGTGLCGEVLRPLASRLEGVDLSKRMLEQAERTGRYDALETADAVEGLRKRSDLDVIVAGDLLIYFGDLAPVLDAASQALAPGGLLAGNVEALEEGTWLVNPTGRFSHSASYVRQAAQAAGFAVLSLERAVLREEDKQPVPGYLMVLQSDK
jgi:predicted TPR repeat methyltransferase